MFSIKNALLLILFSFALPAFARSVVYTNPEAQWYTSHLNSYPFTVFSLQEFCEDQGALYYESQTSKAGNGQVIAKWSYPRGKWVVVGPASSSDLVVTSVTCNFG